MLQETDCNNYVNSFIMKHTFPAICFACISIMLLLSQCAGNESEILAGNAPAPNLAYGGFASQVEWGSHIVTISGCHDCHTPKKMGPNGPELDSSLLLSGHPSKIPPPDVNRGEIESKGLMVTNTLTAWTGPWGISYAANLTPDPIGIGGWDESNFITAIRDGKFKGVKSARSLLPPMPWQMFRNMTDGELKAIFAYLKSTKPIKNIVPNPQLPVLASRKNG